MVTISTIVTGNDRLLQQKQQIKKVMCCAKKVAKLSSHKDPNILVAEEHTAGCDHKQTCWQSFNSNAIKKKIFSICHQFIMPLAASPESQNQIGAAGQAS